MKPPPPTPHENGSVTPSTPAAVTAASTALPPFCSVAIAASVASRSTVAAAPPVPVEVGGPTGATVRAEPAVPAIASAQSPIRQRKRSRRMSHASNSRFEEHPNGSTIDQPQDRGVELLNGGVEAARLVDRDRDRHVPARTMKDGRPPEAVVV